MKNPALRRNLLFTLIFALTYMVPNLINQVLLGHNATVALVLNLYLGGAVGLLTLKIWRKYSKILKNIPRDKVYFLTEPKTLFTVLAFFSFTTILSAVNQYGNLGLFQIVQTLFIGPLLLAVITGNIPLNFRRRRPDWRSR